MKRFENADEVLGEVGKQFGHNLFAYCRNHMVRRKDDDGREDVDVYEEFCSIFANTYDVDFETYIQMPSVTGFLEMAHEARNYELLSATKEIYVENDMDRFAEDNVTFSNTMGLVPPISLSDAFSFALDLMVSASESSSRYSLGDIEREAYTVEYKKRDRFTYTDAYGVSIVLKVDYKIKETYRIGAGKRNGAAYFDGRNISMTIVDRDWEIWENGVKIKK